MMPRRILGLLALWLLPLATVMGQERTKALTNEDVVNMVAGGLDENIIVGAIQANDEKFDVSASGLLALKKAGVDDKIVQTMLVAEARQHNPPLAPVPSMQAQNATPPAVPSGAMNPTAMNPALGQGAAGQAMAMQILAAQGMSPQVLAQISAMQRGGSGMGMFPSAAMSSRMAAGEVDPSQLPKVLLVAEEKKELLNRSITQIAKSEVKGGKGGAGMAPMGSMAALGMRGMGGGMSGLTMMGGLGGTALRFAPLAAGPGIMFAAPAMSLATGLLGGGLTHSSRGPRATYVWALPGAHSAYVTPATKPKFEVEFGNIVGLDPDAYEAALVRLTQTKDNWRLVGATKDSFDKHGNEKQSAITEDRTEIKTTLVGRGHVIIEAAAPLTPGEYGIVLHPIKAHKGSTSTGTAPTAEQAVFYSVWDFSVPATEANATPEPH